MDDDLERFENAELYEEMYIVEKILEKKKYKGIWKYKVKWEGYPLDQCTWEPIENLDNCKHLVEQFEKRFEKSANHKKLKKTSEKEKNSVDVENEEIKNNLPLSNDNTIAFDNTSLPNINTSENLFNNNSIITDTNIEELVPEGNLDEDEPIKIEKATIINDEILELNCFVSWKKNKVGKIPKNTWISSNIIRKRKPELLLQFYESKVKLPKLSNCEGYDSK